MSSPYLQFCAAVIDGGRDAIKEVLDQGISVDHIHLSDAKIVWDFVESYVRSHQGYPDRKTIEGMTSIDVGAVPSEPWGFWLDTIKRLHIHKKLTTFSNEVQALLSGGATQEAYEKWESCTHELAADAVTPARVLPLFPLAAEVEERYKAIKGGLRGVPFPWETVNRHTLGMWPEDLILFAARTGVGKSHCMALIAMHAWQKGHKVLFATTELSQRVIAQRLFAMHLGLPYNDLYRGQLDIRGEQDLADLVQNPPSNADKLDIIGGNFDFRIESLSLAIQDSRADLVIADGAYLLRTKGKNRMEQAAEAFNELKRLAKRHKVPILTTTQFNRKAESAKKETLSLQNIGLTDAAGWNADQVWALFQTEDMRKDKRMVLKNIKCRETTVPDIDLSWDFELMDFREVGPVGGGDADEFGIDDDDEELPF